MISLDDSQGEAGSSREDRYGARCCGTVFTKCFLLIGFKVLVAWSNLAGRQPALRISWEMVSTELQDSRECKGNTEEPRDVP